MNKSLWFLLICLSANAQFETDPMVLYGEDGSLVDVRDAATSENLVYVLTGAEPAVHVFHGSDKQHSWGRKGKGPADLNNPVSIRIFEKKVLVLNRAPNKVVSYQLDGTLLEAVNLTGHVVVHHVAMTGKHLLAQGGDLGGTHSFVYKHGKHHQPLLQLAAAPSFKIKGSSFPISYFQPFAPAARWSLAVNGDIAFWDGDAVILKVMDVDGKHLYDLNLPNNDFPIKDTDHQIWLDRTFPANKAMFGRKNFFKDIRQKARSQVRFPKVSARVLDLKPDPISGFWILRYWGASGEVWTHLRRNVEPKTITLPKGHQMLFFGKHHFLTLSQTEIGDERIALFKRQ